MSEASHSTRGFWDLDNAKSSWTKTLHRDYSPVAGPLGWLFYIRQKLEDSDK